jgi:YidC/Oxa1 family membrane protein insertase
MPFTSFFRHWREFSRFKAVRRDARHIVFYAEDAGAWRHFGPIVNELIGTHGGTICYVTSSPDDPVLNKDDDRIQSFCIGFGFARMMFFMTLEADVMVMTMPDLETYHIKRSRHPVHYVYVFHTMVSSHVIFRREAFDHFDSILCVGPHHHDEIRATEELYGLDPKILIKAGYGNLDTILGSKDATLQDITPSGSGGKRVLIAPSWGDNALIETCGPELVEVLLQAGYRVTLRPHTMTVRHRKKLLAEIGKRFGSNPDFSLELDLTSQGSVQRSDVMISDWSGAALEYAFGLERPVLFVDVPRKVNNSEYERIPCVPIEFRLRPEIGEVVSPDRLSDVPQMVERLCQNPDDRKEQIRELRSHWIYNLGFSGEVAAAYIAEKAQTGATA